MKRLVGIIIFSLMILLFQNCSDIGEIQLLGSSKNSSESSSESDISGNGTGYGGKLGGIYYHYVPGYKCENHPSAFAQIDYAPTEKNSVYTQSKENQCLSLPQSIPNTSLDLGSLQNKVIGYEEKIFEDGALSSSIIPDKPVEIWCVDQWQNPKIEILSTYSETLKQAQTEFYYLSQPKVTELNPARATAIQSVHLNSKYFDLVVDKSWLGLKPGTFQGKLRLLQNENTTQVLQCRLGGYLDARLWPAKAVNFDNFVQYEWSPLDKLFYIISGMSGVAPLAEDRFYTYSPSNNLRQMVVDKVNNVSGVKKFKFNSDRSSVILTAQLEGDASFQLYSKSPNNQSLPVLLNNKLTDIGQAVEDEIFISPNSQYIYYLDGAQETGGDIEAWLRVVDTKSGNITQINQNLSTASDEAVRQFEVSSSLGKVIYSTGFTYVDIWVSDLFGGGRHKLDLSSVLGVNASNPFGGTKYYLEWNMKLAQRWLFVEDRYLILVGHSSTIPSYSMIFVIDLMTEKIIFSKENTGFSSVFPLKGLPAAVISNQGTTANATMNFSFLNLKTAKLRTAAELSADFKLSSNLIEQQSAANLEYVLASDLCKAEGEVGLNQYPLDSQSWLVINKNSQGTNLISLYLFSPSTKSCALINKVSLPSVLMSIVEMYAANKLTTTLYGGVPVKVQISPDKRNILMGIKGRVYLIPTDNHPVIEIYTASNGGPIISEVGFIDNNKVYFSGALIKDYWMQLFTWDLPRY